jgi:hypothetical protein
MDIKAPNIETVAISKLKPWSKNPRIKHAVSSIVSSIENFGYLNPIVVQAKTYRVLAGHGRLQALKAKNVTEVPVIVCELDDQNADAYAVADNKLSDASRFDYSILGGVFASMSTDVVALTGFNAPEISEFKNLAQEVLDASTVGSEAKKTGLYAGQDEDESAVKNDNAMLLVFDTERQLQFVKTEIRRRQGGNEKSIGDVVFEAFAKSKDLK